MNKFELSEAFLIGHEKIDADHSSLVQILNDMVDGFLADDLSDCKLKWKQFSDDLKQHFIDETKIMHDFGFVEYEHEQDHNSIIDRIYTQGQKCNSLEDWEMSLFEMRNELLSTILKHDLKFAEHLVTIGYTKE